MDIARKTMQCNCQILFLLCLELGRHRWKALSFVGASLALRSFFPKNIVHFEDEVLRKILRWKSMVCLLPPSCPCSCPQPPWHPPPSFGRPWQFGNLAKLVVDIHQFRANHSNRFLGILRDTPLQYNTVYCLVSCDIFYIMLHKQNYLFVQFNSKKMNVRFLLLS